MIFVLIPIIFVLFGICGFTGAEDNDDREDIQLVQLGGVVCFIIALVVIFVGIGIYTQGKVNVAKLEAFHDANCLNEAQSGSGNWGDDIRSYNCRIQELRAMDNNIWVGLAYPHVPEKLDYIYINKYSSWSGDGQL